MECVRLKESGRSKQDAGNLMRELQDFYTADPTCLWITIKDGRLWWGFAEPAVLDQRGRPDAVGIVARRITWHCCNINGTVLSTKQLSTRITQINGYQRTICGVREVEAVCRAINDETDPLIERAGDLERATLDTVEQLIQRLHQKDFELLADLLFAALGWRRVSHLGGGMADADLFVEQPATGERAFVQVKSQADRRVLTDYVGRFRDYGCERLFFICHSPKGELVHRGPEKVHIWVGQELARKAVDAGLQRWLLARAA